jgi:hypothetical protein
LADSRATGIEPKVRLYLLVNRKSIDKVTRQYQPKQLTKAQLMATGIEPQ